MTTLKPWKGDITTLHVDAIVNAANETLLGGGGVDGAIHRAAGPQLLQECRTLGGCPTGEAKITKAYKLPCKYVIHAVGPVWTGGYEKEDELLASCYNSCFNLAVKNKIKSIAFPAISTGVYRFPMHRSVEIVIRETAQFLERNETLKKVSFVCFGGSIYHAYIDGCKNYFR